MHLGNLAWLNLSVFTPTETRLLIVLSDGEGHSPGELAPIIDEFATKKDVQNHVTNMRGKLARQHLDIMIHGNGHRYQYALVKSLRAKMHS